MVNERKQNNRAQDLPGGEEDYHSLGDRGRTRRGRAYNEETILADLRRKGVSPLESDRWFTAWVGKVTVEEERRWSMWDLDIPDGILEV